MYIQLCPCLDAYANLDPNTQECRFEDRLYSGDGIASVKCVLPRLKTKRKFSCVQQRLAKFIRSKYDARVTSISNSKPPPVPLQAKVAIHPLQVDNEYIRVCTQKHGHHTNCLHQNNESMCTTALHRTSSLTPSLYLLESTGAFSRLGCAKHTASGGWSCVQ